MLCPIDKYYYKFIIDRILIKCSIEHKIFKIGLFIYVKKCNLCGINYIECNAVRLWK